VLIDKFICENVREVILLYFSETLNISGRFETYWFGMDMQASRILFKVLFIITSSLASGQGKSA